MSHEKTASRGELKPFSDGSYFEGPTTNNTTSARENRSPPRCCRGPMPVEPFWNDRRILLVVLVSQLKGHRMKIRTIALATALALASAAVLAQRAETTVVGDELFGPAMAVWKSVPTSPALALVFRLEAVFDQTPKAGAGARIA